MPGSDFSQQLDSLLQEEGSAARCWANLREPRPQAAYRLAVGPTKPFAWTGENSEIARRNGGRALAAQIAAFEDDANVARYHLVGHSHGGNVILNALRELPRAPAKLARLCSWARRFCNSSIGKQSTPAGSPSRSILLGLRLAWGSYQLLAGLLDRPNSHRSCDSRGTGAGSLPDAISVAMLRRRPLWSGHPSAFVFTTDEAITSLRSAQGITKTPRDSSANSLSRARPCSLLRQPIRHRKVSGAKSKVRVRSGRLNSLIVPKSIGIGRCRYSLRKRDRWNCAGRSLGLALLPLLVMLAVAMLYSIAFASVQRQFFSVIVLVS